MGMETQPRAEKEAPKNESPEMPRIDFSPDHFDEELKLLQETAIREVRELKLPKEKRVPEYLEIIKSLRTGYLKMADAQKESEEHKTAAKALLSSFVLSQNALYGGLEKRGSSNLPLKIEESITIQASVSSYLSELNEKYRKNPGEAIEKASHFWKLQEKCLQIYFDRKPDVTFDAWKNGILRDVALRSIITNQCNWDIVPQDDLRVDAVQKIDLVALSPRDIAYLFQIKPTESQEDGAWQPEQVIPPTGNIVGYSSEVVKGMNDFSVENGLEPSTTRGFIVRMSASGENINKYTGRPSPRFAVEVASYLNFIDKDEDLREVA